MGCGVNNSPALRFLGVDWVGLGLALPFCCHFGSSFQLELTGAEGFAFPFLLRQGLDLADLRSRYAAADWS